MPDNETPTTFEKVFQSLQEVLSRLESAELPLEEALSLYEEGKQLAALCASILESAQLRVTSLSAESPDSQISSTEEIF